MVQRASAMAYIFDSLGYAKRLRDGGVPQHQAEAHAEAARDFMMAELATRSDLLALKSDLLTLKQELQTELRARISELQSELRTRISELQTELRTRISELQSEFRCSNAELQTEFRGSNAELRNSITELRSALETQSLRLTVRLGVMLVVAIGALATILKLV
jgi:Skp family chaperone for outer membrane proteins